MYPQGVGERVAVGDGAAGCSRRGSGEAVGVALAVAVRVEVLVEVAVTVGLVVMVAVSVVTVLAAPGVAIWIEMFSPLHAV